MGIKDDGPGDHPLIFFSVTAVVPILLMASYVSGHKEIPH